MNKKHTFEDRLKYMHMLEDGASIKSIEREYGINHSLLTTLWEKYQHAGIEGLVKKRNIRATPELKRQIVEEIVNNSLSLNEVYLKYDVSSSAIYEWMKIYESKGYAGLYERKKRGRPPGIMGRPKKKTLEEMTELERLQYENERLRAEVALLKKVKALVEERDARLCEIGRKPSKN